ncbi:MAG: TIGR02281 family clan AA aspartic protease [Rhodobacteraceae bacterium]|nr:TIGR02281 family clan AA aspartic protease [Paracoccaceae bacterium]
MDNDSLARLAYLGLLLAAVAGWVLVEYRKRMGEALRVAMAWGLIFLGLMAGYGLWSDIRTDVLPRQAVIEGDAIRLPRSEDGHYYLVLEVNGTKVPFMVDTGASDIVLSRSDARRLGIDPASLLYLGQANTANGLVRTARVRLETITLGPHTDTGLNAVVTEGDMDGSLLGMAYLRRYRIEIADGQMILRR